MNHRSSVGSRAATHAVGLACVALMLLAACDERAERVPEAIRPAATAEFGIWAMDAAGELHFVPTSRVPLVEDQPYGWRIWVGPSDEPRTWTETLRLPAAPVSWEGVDEDPAITVSPDGTTATTRGESLPEEGYLMNYWVVALDDPLGEYSIEVELPGGARHAFDFELVDVPLEEEEEVEPATRI